MATGKRVADELILALDQTPGHLRDDTKVLDFGCGCGRVLTYLHHHAPKPKYVGIDVDSDAIKWCQDNLKFGRFFTNPADPPTQFSDCSFDVIYTVSVFSHLDALHTREWIQELSRLLRPKGILLITLHDPTLLPLQKREEVRANGFYFEYAKGTAWFKANKSEWYGTTYMSEDYIIKSFTGFELVNYTKQGCNGYQDVAILRRT